MYFYTQGPKESREYEASPFYAKDKAIVAKMKEVSPGLKQYDPKVRHEAEEPIKQGK